MGNKTNVSKWSAQERLAHIERIAYWRGWVRRGDLCDRFSISLPQASADIGEYMRVNPSGLRYNGNDKRYDATEAFKCRLTKPSLADATELLADAAAVEPLAVARVELLARAARADVVREVVRTIANSGTVEIYYYSVHSGTEGWRQIAPRALAHDGFRWHARSWCLADKAYKDFVLGRIDRVKRSDIQTSLPKDKDWETWTTIRFRPHHLLNPAQRRAMELDFAMVRGVAVLRVRKAMKIYAEAYLGLIAEESSGSGPRLERA
jgi:hypothetical protein